MFGDAAEAVAGILKDIGVAVDAIASAMEDVFNEAANAVGQILDDIGETASQIAGALENVFNEAASAIGSLLSDLGFSNSTIDAIGGAFASFGEDVKNCFESFFTDC